MINFPQQYPPPLFFKRQDGSARYAFMTIVMRNDSFIPGALVFGYALRNQSTQADLICLVTKDITEPSRLALENIFDRVVEVEEIFVAHKRRQERQDRPFLFTRFQALRSGKDGGLGMQYDKIVLADADVLPLRNYDHLFTLDTPAGIINETKSSCMDYDSNGKYIIPASVGINGKWKWHDLYDPLCPHGEKIPRELTDRIITDSKNMGINSSLWVLEPSRRTYEKILTDITKPEIKQQIGETFDWPEMQFATMFWSGKWTSIDLRFSSFNGYPQLDVLCGTHFAGFKPWKYKEYGTFTRFSRFPDYALWHRQFLDMMVEYHVFHKSPKLARLESEIRSIPQK
jgi:alpha-N-acetylglucosamine transferase